MDPAVVAVLVSHDGARWLPAVIDGLRSQTAPVSSVVAVDTGSRDEGPDLLLDAFGEVVTLTSRAAEPDEGGTTVLGAAPSSSSSSFSSSSLFGKGRGGSLEPDRKGGEGVRNFPVRQPLLWL